MRPSATARQGRRRRRLAPLALVTGLLLTTTGCSQSTVDQWKRAGLPAGITNQANRITSLWTSAWIAALIVGVLVWGLILWATIAFRRRKNETGLPAQVRYNLPIEILYTAVPLVLVLTFFYFTARDESAITKIDKNVDVKINVVAKRWSWDFNYLDQQGKPVVYESGTPGQPPTLWLPQGESVEYILTSRDVIHSFWVPTFLFKMDVIPGRVNRFEATAEKLGTYAGKCAELCGVDHSRMLFNVKVVSPQDYEQHLKDLAAAGQTGALPSTLGPDSSLDQGEGGAGPSGQTGPEGTTNNPASGGSNGTGESGIGGGSPNPPSQN
ncbi:MAG: aa3-type cytochrome oxidase subunit II [Motilibacteraceae bacterium]